ncbi:MAG TPA: FHA domain-containing protein [Planctomycetota bacterium]|nr:FHA domain-containing protein [Planctomycetota bacterium]
MDTSPGDEGILVGGASFESPSSMTLVVTTGSDPPRAFGLAERRRTIIGRELDSQLVLEDQRVSRRHASIELVNGQHLLRDLGSSNGTFLNGLRVNVGHAFALREGDIVEIGNARIIYASTLEGALAPAVADGEACSHPLADLVRDGYQRLQEGDRTALQVAIQRAFVGVTPPVGLERCAAIVGERLAVQTVVIFMADPRRTLRPIAATPRVEAVTESAIQLAFQAWSTHEGRLRVAGYTSEAIDLGATGVHGERSAAATPLLGPEWTGAIAVERAAGRRLHRTDLSLLAVLGERIAQTLVLQAGNDGDTRLGFGG